MFKKQQILNDIVDAGVIAVIRAENYNKAINICDALVNGGIKGLELTFSTPNNVKAIEEVSYKYRNDNSVCIGGGTVIDSITARMAIMAGAKYIVSPGFVADIAKICNLYSIPYLPGCATITEIQTALESGVEIIKLFPGSSFDPSYIKSIKAPFPDLNVMPTGGVSLNNMDEWFNAGAIAVGSGGNLTELDGDNYSKITDNAKKWSEKLIKIRQKVR